MSPYVDKTTRSDCGYSYFIKGQEQVNLLPSFPRKWESDDLNLKLFYFYKEMPRISVFEDLDYIYV